MSKNRKINLNPVYPDESTHNDADDSTTLNFSEWRGKGWLRVSARLNLAGVASLAEELNDYLDKVQAKIDKARSALRKESKP